MEVLNIFISFFVGIFASFIASKIFLNQNNKNNQPQIDISNSLIEAKKLDNTKCIQFKLVNLTDQDLIDVEVNLFGIKNQSPNKNIPIITNTEISKRSVAYISKLDMSGTLPFYL